MKKGEIWLVDFDPSVGNEYQKMRPALILQSDLIKSKLKTVMPISSKVDKYLSGDIKISKDDINRLFSDSVIKVHQISSFDRKRFINRIGVVSENIIFKVEKYLKEHFSLNPKF